jgi:hypothetical protein
MNGTRGLCSPIVGTDDADSCTGTKTCGSSTKCLTIDDEQIRIGLGFFVGAAPARLQVAQVVTIRGAGQLVEVRIAFWCENKDDLLSVTVNAVNSDGTPSAKVLSNTRLQEHTFRYAAPDGEANFSNYPLVTSFSVKAGDRLALVAEAPSATGECLLYGAREEAYPGGDGYALLDETPRWEGLGKDAAFQTLVAR